MLACFEGADGRRDMKRIRGGDDHGIDFWIGQHAVIIRVGPFGSVGDGHPLTKIIGHFADRPEFGVARLGATLEMSGLGNLACPQHADAQAPVFLLSHYRILRVRPDRLRHPERGRKWKSNPNFDTVDYANGSATPVNSPSLAMRRSWNAGSEASPAGCSCRRLCQ